MQARCSEALYGHAVTPGLVTPRPGGCFLQGGLLYLAQSRLSRSLPRLAASADTWGGKTAWPWQLPARKEPTGAREKPFPYPDLLQQPW